MLGAMWTFHDGSTWIGVLIWMMLRHLGKKWRSRFLVCVCGCAQPTQVRAHPRPPDTNKAERKRNVSAEDCMDMLDDDTYSAQWCIYRAGGRAPAVR